MKRSALLTLRPPSTIGLRLTSPKLKSRHYSVHLTRRGLNALLFFTKDRGCRGRALACGLGGRLVDRLRLGAPAVFPSMHERRARVAHDLGGAGVVCSAIAKRTSRPVSPLSGRTKSCCLTGWNEPEAMMLLVPKPHQAGAAAELRRRFFHTPGTTSRRKSGRAPSLARRTLSAPARTGFKAVRDTAFFSSDLKDALKSFPRIYTELTPEPESRAGYGGDGGENARDGAPGHGG